MNIQNYNHLFYFYITAKLNGVTLAAKHLNTSQSSLSVQIKTLEGALNKSLFKKSGRKLELTDTGKEVYSYCRRAFGVFDEMLDQIEQKSISMGARLSIGVSAEIERPFVSETLTRVSKQYAKGRRPLFNLVSLSTDQLIQLLKIGELDLLMTTGIATDPAIEVVADFELPVSLLVHSDFLARSKGRPIQNMLSRDGVPVVLPSKLTDLRAEIDRFFIRKKLHPICLFESNIISAVVRSASDGLGATIVPEAYVIRELKTARLFKVNRAPLWQHRVSLMMGRGTSGEHRGIFLKKLGIYLESAFDIKITQRREIK